MTIEDAEVRVTSVPACAYLLCMHFTPLGVVTTPRGSALRFSPAARDVLSRWYAAKATVDQYIAAQARADAAK